MSSTHHAVVNAAMQRFVGSTSIPRSRSLDTASVGTPSAQKEFDQFENVIEELARFVSAEALRKYLFGKNSISDVRFLSTPEFDSDVVMPLANAAFWKRVQIPDYHLLGEALSDLDSLNEEAKESDLPEPDEQAIANARTMLPQLYDILPVRYQVVPTERRGVSINAPMKHGAAVAVECAPNDIVYCFATIGGNGRRAKFYQMDGLPDVFIEKALRDLAAG